MQEPAAVGLGASGLIGLGFTRAGKDPEAVISKTVKQAMTGLPKGTKLREVKPDLVSLADAAARLKVTRQALQKRKMPPPSLGGLYRASEMPPYLDAVPGKLRDGFSRRSGMVCRCPRGTTGKRQDQSCGGRTPWKVPLVTLPGRRSS